MDLKKFSPEVYKSIHFLKANCIRILKSVVLVKYTGWDNNFTGWNKKKSMRMVDYYSHSTVHIKQIHGKKCAPNIA